MADELEPLMGSTSGEDPSPDFMASLRERIVAESTMEVALGTEDSGVVLNLLTHEENDMNNNGWIIGALVAAALAIVIGFAVVLISDDEPSLITDDPETTTTQAPTTTEAQTTTQAPATTETPATTIPEVSEQAIATVEGFLAASDVDGLKSFMTEAGFEGNTSGLQADEWLVLRQVVGVEAEVLSCIQVGAETNIRCSLSLTSKITETLGEGPYEADLTFNVDDGLITTWPAMTHAGFNETANLANAAGFRDDWQAACLPRVTVECAEFVMENLDAWIAAAPRE